MAKQQPTAVVEKTRAKVFRVVPHVGADGKPVPERWDMEEVVVSGVVANVPSIVSVRVEPT